MVRNHRFDKLRPMKICIFIGLSLLLVSCSPKNKDITIEKDVSEYVRVYLDTKFTGAYRNVIEYVYRGNKKETIIDTSRFIYRVVFNVENDLLYALSDVGLFEVDFKNGTYTTISSESVSEVYQYKEEIYYHKNIGALPGDVYKTEICNVSSTNSCNTFDFYVSSFSIFEDTWYIMERDHNIGDEKFYLHTYTLDFKPILNKELDDYIEEETPVILSSNEKIYYVYDSGVILDSEKNIVYSSSETTFTITAQIDPMFKYIIIPKKDIHDPDVDSFDILDLSNNSISSITGEGYTTMVNNGLVFSKTTTENTSEKITFFHLSFDDLNVQELGYSSNSDVYELGIFPLNLKEEVD